MSSSTDEAFWELVRRELRPWLLCNPAQYPEVIAAIGAGVFPAGYVILPSPYVPWGRIYAVPTGALVPA